MGTTHLRAFKVTWCYLCSKPLYGVSRYRVELVVGRGPLKGSLMKVIYLCGDCLTNLRNDRDVRKYLKIRYRKMPTLPPKPEQEHPITKLREVAVSTVTTAYRRLLEVEAMINAYEGKLDELRRELIRKYGVGYLTTKTVRNRVGKKYRYIVYRTEDGKEIYVKDELGKKVIEVRKKLRELRKEALKLEKIRNRAYGIVRISDIYANNHLR